MSRFDWFLMLTLSVLWGGSFLFNALALQGLPVLSVVWGRVAVAALVLGVVLRARGIRVPAAAWGALAVMGLLNNVIPFTLFVFAQSRIEVGFTAILNATTPLWTVLVAHLALSDERMTKARALAVLFGFAGVVVLAGGATGGALPAVLACLMAALSYAFASVWGRRFRQMGLTPFATAFGQLTASSLMLTPVWLLVDRPWAMPLPAAGPLLAVLALAILSTALAYGIFFRLLASAGAVALSLVTFLIPVSAALLGAVVLDEALALRHIAGFGLIAAGLGMMQRDRARRA